MSELLYLEDVFVGQRFVTATHPLTADEIKAFARAYDPQPFHTDEQAAKDTFFKGLAASGWHTAAITMRLQVDNGPKIAGRHDRRGRRIVLAHGGAAGRRASGRKRSDRR